jgi:hypothetical protein
LPKQNVISEVKYAPERIQSKSMMTLHAINKKLGWASWICGQKMTLCIQQDKYAELKLLLLIFKEMKIENVSFIRSHGLIVGRRHNIKKF